MKKFYSLLLVLLMAGLSTQTAKAYGLIHDGGTWSIYEYINRSGFTLYIDDASVCRDYSSSDATPWHEFKSGIHYVQFRNYTSSNWNVGAYMFADMTHLESAYIQCDNHGSQEIGAHAFDGCEDLETIDLSDVVSVGDYAFYNCKDWLEQVDLTSANLTSIGKYAFANCSSLERVNFSPSVGDFTIGERAFDHCSALSIIDLSNARQIGKYAFGNDDDLTYAYLRNCTSLGEYAFYRCNLNTVILGNSLTSIGNYAFQYGIEDNAAITAIRSTPPTLGSGVFDGVNCSTVYLYLQSESAGTAYNISPWNQFIRNAAGLTIYGVYNGTTLTIYYDESMVSRGGSETWWNWEHATERARVSKVIFDDSMEAAHPESTASWFYGFENLTVFEDISLLNTGMVTEMNDMFDGCKSLRYIDLSNFNTANVQNMNTMFHNCESLTSIDVNPLDISRVTSTYGMFSGCKNLEIIYCETDWNIYSSNITLSMHMFSDCDKLKGGKGTLYNPSYLDLSFARPDDGPDSDAPGYFWREGDTGEEVLPPNEGIDEVPSDKVQSTKVIRNGQLIIIRGDKTFNALGAEIK